MSLEILSCRRTICVQLHYFFTIPLIKQAGIKAIHKVLVDRKQSQVFTDLVIFQDLFFGLISSQNNPGALLRLEGDIEMKGEGEDRWELELDLIQGVRGVVTF